jgi:mannitol-specific phosphotransferase system IIBC component
MKTLKTMALSGAMALASGGSALAAAVDTSKTYSSGLLIGLFLAFCALLVVVQMIPSIMLLVGFIKGLARRTETKSETTAGVPKA